MDARLGRHWRSTLGAFVLLGGVTALCWTTSATTTAGADLTLLYAVPVSLLALSRGLRGGLAGAGAATALVLAWTAFGPGDLDVLGCSTRAVAFLVLGGVAGFLTDERAHSGDADNRWFEMTNDMIAEVSLDGYFTRLNDRWERHLGWSREELMGRPMFDFVHPDDLTATLAVGDALSDHPGEIVNFENRYRTKDGSWRWLLWNSRSDESRKYAVARDITDRKQLEDERKDLLARVETMARTDTLTGLPNRRSWDEEVRQAVARARRNGHPLTLAMADIDNFKRFNDRYGHQAGDALLSSIAVAWRLALRSTDFVARYGGEEFGLLLPDCPPAEAVRLLDRLRESTPQQQSCSVGVALWDRSESPEQLLARADAALYEAKRAGRDQVVTARAST